MKKKKFLSQDRKFFFIILGTSQYVTNAFDQDRNQKTEIRLVAAHFHFFLSLTHQPLYMFHAKAQFYFDWNNHTFFSFSFILRRQENERTRFVQYEASTHIFPIFRFLLFFRVRGFFDRLIYFLLFFRVRSMTVV